MIIEPMFDDDKVTRKELIDKINLQSTRLNMLMKRFEHHMNDTTAHEAGRKKEQVP